MWSSTRVGVKPASVVVRVGSTLGVMGPLDCTDITHHGALLVIAGNHIKNILYNSVIFYCY